MLLFVWESTFLYTNMSVNCKYELLLNQISMYSCNKKRKYIRSTNI